MDSKKGGHKSKVIGFNFQKKCKGGESNGRKLNIKTEKIPEGAHQGNGERTQRLGQKKKGGA